MSKKTLTIKIILTVITLSIVIPVILFLINKIDSNYMGDNKLYGTVIETGANYAKVKSIDDNIYIINTDESLTNGDFIVAYFKENDKSYSGKNSIEIIAHGTDILIETVTSTTITTEEITTTTTLVTTSTSTSNTLVNKTEKKYTDEEIVSYIKNEYDTSSSSDETLKDKFINIVDFIFFDKEINGRTFSSLKSECKAKILYYTLLLDSKIEEYIPNYKETLSTKYSDIKSKIIALYMENIVGVCSENTSTCDTIKEDFNVVKEKLKLTWNIIYSAFKYAANTSKSHLVEWYQTFKEK